MDHINSSCPFTKEKGSPLEIVLECIGNDLEKVDQEFRNNLRSDVPIISAIGEYLLLSGGKRFRAKLLLLSSKLCEYHGNLHISMASLIEFIPNGEMRPAFWSETFSLPNVFLFSCRVEIGRSSRSCPRQPRLWLKES
jgi:hypothetical protein